MLVHSPFIVREDLLFYYDMYNTQKSWKGKPATNLFTNGHFANGLGMPEESGSNPTNIIVSLINPGLSNYVLAQSGTNAEYQLNRNNLSASTTYCLSGWFSTSGEYNGSETMFHCRAYSSSGNHVALGTGIGTVLETKTVGNLLWKYCYVTITTPSDFYAFEWYVGYGATNTLGYRYYTNLMMEVGSFPSPYVNGTRSNTQALIDLTNNNIITKSSDIIYNTDNTFSFGAGATKAMGTGITSKFGDFTVAVWFKSTGGSLDWNRIVDKKYDTGMTLMRYSTNSNQWGGSIIDPTFPHGIFITLADNQWHYLVTRRQGNTHTIFGDGLVNTASKSCSASLLDTSELVIGSWYNGYETQRFYGQIPIVQIYNRGLSNNEIYQNFNAQRGRFGV